MMFYCEIRAKIRLTVATMQGYSSVACSLKLSDVDLG